MMDAIDLPKVSKTSVSPTPQLSTPNTTKLTSISNTSTNDTPKVATLLTPISSCSDENLRFLVSNPYQATFKMKSEQRNKHLRNNFVLNTNGSTGNRILLQQLCHERKQAAIERELRLQKSLSEECEDLGVGEPSTSDLFPEADLLFDTCSPAFDASQDTTTPSDATKHRIFFQTMQTNRSNEGDDVKSSDDDEKRCKLNKISSDAKGSTTPIFLRIKDETMMSSDFEISPYVQENSSSSGGTNDKKFLESSVKTIEVKKEEERNEDSVNDDAKGINADSSGDFDKLKNSMDWEGGPKKTYSKSSVRILKQPQELALTTLTKTISSETQPTLISITSPLPPLHQRRITQYHNKKKIPLNHGLSTIKSPKNDVIIIQRKRRLSLDNSTNEEKSATSVSEKITSTPYIHNHSIGSSSGNISSSFKIINSNEGKTISSLNASNPPKIINHQMRRGSSQTVFDEEVIYGTVNSSNVKASKQIKKR